MAASENEDEEMVDELDQKISDIIADIAIDPETTCSICQAEFLDSDDLLIHVKQVHDAFPASANFCEFCDAHYTDLDDYAVHVRDIHFRDLKCCNYCTKAFIDHKEAKRHEKRHISQRIANTDLHSCSQCPAIFTTMRELTYHEKANHDNNIDGVFMKCMSHLSALLNLKVPALLQFDNDVGFVCVVCDFTSLDLTTYIQHISQKKCRSFVCSNCSSAFKSRKNLFKHLGPKSKCLDTEEYRSELTTCPECKKEVNGKKLSTHLRVCSVVKCVICDIIFDTVDELSHHQSAEHPSELGVTKCDFCYKEYVGKKGLQKHIDRAHRPMFHLYKYACKERDCRSIFMHPQKLFAHYYTRHKNLEPYTCKICDKKFRVRKGFTIHIKLVHKGIGFVEFDENYLVYFTATKSDNPFVPKCVIPELLNENGSGKGQAVSKGKNPTNGETDAEDDNQNNITNDETDAPTDDDNKVSKIKTVSSKFEASTDIDSDVPKSKGKTIEIELEPKPVTKFKMIQKTTMPKKNRKRRRKDPVINVTSDEEDEEESLLVVKKRALRKKFHEQMKPSSRNMLRKKRQQFTCTICNKYCYTYQNYNNHMILHKKNKPVECCKCIKCGKSFKTKKELSEHVASKHSSSKLIETLKTLKERKQVETAQQDESKEFHVERSVDSLKFLKTMKKVKIEKCITPATIKPAPTNLSVKKFIENFVPDGNEAAKDCKFAPVASLRRYSSPYFRKQMIKMTKFQPDKSKPLRKLKMPERFKEEPAKRVHCVVKMVHQPLKPSPFEDTYSKHESDQFQESGADQFQEYNDYDDDKTETIIPDVAQEVMLEESGEDSKQPDQSDQMQQQIIISKMPKGVKTMHIATLQTKAPYFKIIKVKSEKEGTIFDAELANNTDPKPSQSKPPQNDIIKLKDGTKLVTVNPLAHLLGDKPLEEVLEPVKNYNKPVTTDFKGLLAKALQRLDTPSPRKPRTKKAKKPEKMEEATETT